MHSLDLALNSFQPMKTGLTDGGARDLDNSINGEITFELALPNARKSFFFIEEE